MSPTGLPPQYMGGRVNDPATAPMIPVYSEINMRPGGGDVTILGWNRDRDEIVGFRFTVDTNRDPAEMFTRPVDADDAEWLHNIGARP